MAKIKFNFSEMASGIYVPLLVLAILAMGYFLIYHAFRGSQTRVELLNQKTMERDKKQSELGQIGELISELDKNQKSLSLLDEALPPAPRIPELLSNFEYLAKQSGVVLNEVNVIAVTDVSPKAPPAKSPPSRETFSGSQEIAIMEAILNLGGTYGAIKNFLLNTEQNLRLFDVESLALETPADDSQVLEFSLRLKTYYQKGSAL